VGDGRKDAATGRLSGRARDGRLVHFNVTPSETDPTGNAEGVRPGDVVTTVVTYGAPHHLVADGKVLTHRATKAGDAWAAGKATKLPGVSLGMPGIGKKPLPKQDGPGCAC
jgi:tRNA-2-methylthio-N6-dimethylallyladenosine synthase